MEKSAVQSVACNSSESNGSAPARTLLEVVSDYVAAGLSILPVRTDGSKRPDGQLLPRTKRGGQRYYSSWVPLQERLPTRGELLHWYERKSRGIAIICGAISGGLEVLDCDQAEHFQPWRELVEAQRPGLLERLPIVRTPNGYHLYYHCDEIEGNQPDIARDADGKVIFETRGEGGYVLAPGCPPKCHPTGRTYELHSGPPLTEIPDISGEERDVLLSAARSFGVAAPAAECEQHQHGDVHDHDAGARPGDIYNATATWEDILQPAGWVRVSQAGDLTHWCRPGKDHGTSATTGVRSDCGKDLLYVFSSNAAPFTAGKSYTKFAAYALLRHGGDFSAAVRELGRDSGALSAHPPQKQQPPHRLNGTNGNGHAPPAAKKDKEAEPQRLVARTFDQIESRPVFWLAKGRIPYGKVTVLDGDPGLGKSTLLLDIAARVTGAGNGFDPDHNPIGRGIGNVCILSAEDDPEDTIRPRLELAGAQLSRVHLLEAVVGGEDGARPLEIPEDLGLIESCLQKIEPHLLIIDPLMAFLGKVDSNNDQSIRKALYALSQMAKRVGCAIVCQRHLNKGNSPKAMYRGGGSIAISAHARCALLVAEDPDDPQKRVLAVVKANLSVKAPTMRFVLEPVSVTLDGTPDTICRIKWLGDYSQYSADDLVKPPELDRDGSGEPKVTDRQRVLMILQEHDGPVQLKDIAAKLGKKNSTVAMLLDKMLKENLVTQPKYGHYSIPEAASESDEAERDLLPMQGPEDIET
jgi:hypothetical protein